MDAWCHPRGERVVRPRLRKVLRDIWLHKARTALVIMAIVVGIVGAGAVLDTWALIRKATRDEFRDSNPASATLRVDAASASIDATLLARVRARPGILDAQARRQVLASARLEDGARTVMLFVHDDFRKIGIGVVKPETGAWPPADGTMVLESSSVEFSGLGLGSPIPVQIGDGATKSLEITGTARDVGLAPGWMEHVVYGFVTRNTLAELGAASALDELQIVVRDAALDRAAIRRIAYDVKTLVEEGGRRVVDVAVPVPGRHIHAAQIDSLLFTQGAFGALALLLSGFLVVNLISAMLTGQVREIGVMKAIGASACTVASGAKFVLLSKNLNGEL